MKYLLSLLLLVSMTAIAAPKQGKVYNFPLGEVKDGDTVTFQANFLPPPLKPVLAVRILGVDTPEKGFRAKCPDEAAKGEAASKFTKAAVANAKSIQFEIVGWDKFGGRVLGDVILDGNRLSQMLIKNGHAREYWGKAKQSWCN
jgi:endonuclease YncB( thermonuclease family)